MPEILTIGKHPPRFEDEFPEEAETLMGICNERGVNKENGERNKPLYLDTPQPIVMEYKNNRPSYKSVATIKRTEDKVGRNEKCPCGSNKKYKKCCME